jgi:hypothetical protein
VIAVAVMAGIGAQAQGSRLGELAYPWFRSGRPYA